MLTTKIRPNDVAKKKSRYVMNVFDDMRCAKTPKVAIFALNSELENELALTYATLFSLPSRALYNGIVPGLQRQMAFSAIRIGAYENVKRTIMDKTGCKSKNK